MIKTKEIAKKSPSIKYSSHEYAKSQNKINITFYLDADLKEAYKKALKDKEMTEDLIEYIKRKVARAHISVEKWEWFRC